MKIEPEHLVALAIEMRERAYAPYSNYAVGAAVLTREGDTFEGCNVENASYGLTVCAERAALFAAVAAGRRRIAAIAVASGPGASMCGACRQVLREFADDETRVFLAAADGTFRERRVDELLPDPFT